MRTHYEIGVLRLDPEARVLTQDGVPVALGARAVAVLSALVSRANEYVPKAEIMDAAWPGLVVEEANLAVQISAIRRALATVGGDGWIETLARRGYRFTGPVVASAGRRPDLPATPSRSRTNLPQALTSFVGREREIAEIKQLLPAIRLLTLTGTGGIGKTRLALQAAAEVHDAYRDGVWFVDLASLRDPALVPSAVAQVLAVTEAADKPLLVTLCEHLRGKELLLVLDNCEHLLAACADLADTLLRDTARVSVVATSREALHVGGEQTHPLNALPLPDPKSAAASIARSDAVQLFVDRARQHRPRFDLEGTRARAVAQICVRLDGLPLALELAAARVAALPVEEIVQLLDQRFRLLTRGGELPRQQTLRAMIDWSFELLDSAEQQLFARLSAFAGGWTVAAAKAIGAGGTIAEDDVVYLLIALIDKSLVVADEDGDRYRMLETVRAYALEKLTGSGSEEAVLERHRDYFLALAEDAKQKLSGAEQSAWLQRLDDEHENLRAGLHWSLASGNASGGLRLCGALQRFWWTRGHVSEGREWCARALGSPGVQAPTPERARALSAAGVLAYYQGDYPAASAMHAQSLAIARQLGDRRGVSRSLINLGNIACDSGDYAAAPALYEESLAIMRELGDREGTVAALVNLANMAWDQGDYTAVPALCEEGLAIARELGNRSSIADALHMLGRVAYEQRDYPAARARHEESLSIFRELGDEGSVAHALHMLGSVAHEESDYPAAVAHYWESLAIRRALGDKLGIAFSLAGLAATIAALGSPLRAARLWGAAEALRAEIGSPLTPIDRAPFDQCVAASRAALADDAAFDRAWQEGRAMTTEQAIELALEKTVPPR